eukprot:scaffold1439_cov404-Prasinococcus_capsulatus_cf.AAC.66
MAAADFANMSAAEASLRRKQQARSPKEPGSKLSTIFGKIFESRSFTAGDSVANFMAGEHPMVLFSGDPKKVREIKGTGVPRIRDPSLIRRLVPN